jgi:hypothetical protein
LSWEGPFAIADSGVGMILDTESVRNGNDIADLATLDKFTAPQP